MRDDEHGLAADEFLKRTLNGSLVVAVEGAGRLVVNEHWGVAEEGAGWLPERLALRSPLTVS